MTGGAITYVTLNDESRIPVVGYGTGTAHYNKDCEDEVLQALDVGYVSFDTAEMYGNEASVGNAIHNWKAKRREEVYILTKWGKKDATDDPQEARHVLEKALKDLQMEYVNMYLIHSPLVSKVGHQEQWKVMEKIVEDGLAMSIGVSNFREEDLLAMSVTWKIPPAVNQIEYSPYIWHQSNMVRLRKLMDQHNIKVQAYGPLSPVHRKTGGPVDSVVQKISEKTKATPAQILLQWAAQHGGGTVVTTSRNEDRMKEFLNAFKLPALSDEDVEAIAEAGRGIYFRQFMTDVWDQAKP